MNTRRSFLEGASGALLLSFVPWSPAYGAQVVDVRAWPAEEYTRITIEHDAPMKFKYFVLRNSDPVRLAVDIDGLLLTDKLKQIIQKVKPNDPYISRIRVGQNRPNVVRISIDFKTDVDPQVFSLKPAGQYRYRLVFDIYPATQKDPLMAIIQRKSLSLTRSRACWRKWPRVRSEWRRTGRIREKSISWARFWPALPTARLLRCARMKNRKGLQNQRRKGPRKRNRKLSWPKQSLRRQNLHAPLESELWSS